MFIILVLALAISIGLTIVLYTAYVNEKECARDERRMRENAYFDLDGERQRNKELIYHIDRLHKQVFTHPASGATGGTAFDYDPVYKYTWQKPQPNYSKPPPKSTPARPPAPTVFWGSHLVTKHGGWREAVKATHPDNGGNRIDFESVMKAKDL
jgi:hypothetical protein